MDIDTLFADPGFFDQLQRVLHTHGNRRFPVLRRHMDDLASQTLSDLWRYATRSPSVFQALNPQQHQPYAGAEWDTIVRIAMTILSRRAADLYRRSALAWAEGELSQGTRVDAIDSGEPSLPRHMLLRQMLQACMIELARSSAADREILLNSMGGLDDAPAASEADRQRLSRLRKRLATAIQRELGESAKSLLSTELRDE